MPQYPEPIVAGKKRPFAGAEYLESLRDGREVYIYGRGVQAQIGEAIGWRNLFWSLTDAMACNPVPWVNGAVLPNPRGSAAYRLFMTEAYPAVLMKLLWDAVGTEFGARHESLSAEHQEEGRIRPLIKAYPAIGNSEIGHCPPCGFKP